MGRRGDTAVGHLTPGEIVIPKSAQTPGLMGILASNLRRQGANPAQYVVGSNMSSRNPYTGLQEFADPNSFDYIRNMPISPSGYYVGFNEEAQPNMGYEQLLDVFPGYDPTKYNIAPLVEGNAAQTDGATDSESDGPSDGSTEGGPGSGVSSGRGTSTQAGRSTKAGQFGAQPDFETGRNVRNVGRVVGALAPGLFGTLAGMGISTVGTMADVEEANAHLAARGFPDLNTFSAILNTLSPFSFFGQSPVDQYNAMMGFNLGPAVEYDDMVQGALLGNWGPIGAMGFDDSYGDAFGGWGGYGSPANQGPGADIESEPDDLASAISDANNEGGRGGRGGPSASDVDDAADTTSDDDDEY